MFEKNPFYSLKWVAGVCFLMVALLLGACQTIAPTGEEAAIRVLATTTIVGDVVGQVGGERIALTVLLPVGADPHHFDATPQDVARIQQADLVFANGAGLETFLQPILESGGGADKVVELSDGLSLRPSVAELDEEADEAEHEAEQGDPHTWTDPNNVVFWLGRIVEALSAADPAGAEIYRQNAERYRQELVDLDAWIRQQVNQIPPENRQIVTDHLAFGYFADRYGFIQVGALVPSYSTLAEPSAQQLAELEDAIRSLGVRAVFVGNTVNPALAQRVAEDTGVRLVTLYTGSLTSPEGEAPTYLDYMRYNVLALVNALK